MSEQLQPNGNPVRVGGITLRTPGLTGVATSHLPAGPATRSASQGTGALESALRNEGMRTTETIEIGQTREVPTAAARTRSTSFGEPAIEVEVPDPGEQWGQVILYTDEAGVTTWNFARDEANRIDATRGRGTRTYVIRRRVNSAEAQPGTRGLVGMVGMKVLKVLAFPLLDPVVGEVSDFFAGLWEAKKRPYRVRLFTPDDYAAPNVAPISDSDWQRLSRGRALMLVHGTFSRAHTAFGSLPREYVAALDRRYRGRVFAFDHFTLSEDPRQNVEWLTQQIPAGLSLDLDIISHSRGGLVSRVLAERQAQLSLGDRSLRIRRIVFVATPNAGTVLANPGYIGDFIDAYTNILNFFPDNGVTETLEAIIAVVKQIAVAAAKGLDGLSSMRPEGPFLTELNQTPRVGTRYFALASNYEPSDTGLIAYAKDVLLDKIFAADNDLIVPTAGVWDHNGSGQFPIAQRHIFAAGAGVAHSGFFGDATARERILGWLGT